MIRGIIFDCFGVLYGGSLESLLNLCPPERLTELRDLNKQSDYGFISGADYLAGLADIFGMPLDEVRALLAKKHIRNQQLAEYVVALRHDYKVGLLSNVSSGTIEELFTNEERHELFDAEVLSYQEHLLKPNPAIFELMAQRMGLTTGECVMIDDLASNCEGAEIAGMKSIQHITNQRTKELLQNLLQQ
ncbi:MAG: HAD-IA family hydrolase [Candidatus Saccharimonas sp.]|jgi:putative hydrolase of the HAD superfamily|nr:HAD-IA family hydrolase [Candidatus Saccharimonas sp.]